MLKEALGIREGILADLHNDHQEVSTLFSRILKAEDNHERGQLFRELMDKLLAHAQAEQKVLYRRLQKSENATARKFAFEGEVEHKVVENQLQQLARTRNKESEQWTPRLTFLKEAVEKHVKEEESTGFSCADDQFDTEELEKLGQLFQREKAKIGAAA